MPNHEDNEIRGLWSIYGQTKPALMGFVSQLGGKQVLEVSSALTQSVKDVLMSADESECCSTIHGTDENGEAVTLFGCHTSNWKSSLGLRTWKIDVLLVLKGLEVESLKTPRFRAVSLRFQHLKTWIGRRALRMVQSDSGAPSFSVAPGIDLLLPIETGASVRLCSSTSISTNRYEETFRPDPAFWLHFEQPTSLKHITVYWIPWISGLLTLLFGETATAECVELFDSNPFEAKHLSPPTKCQIFWRRAEPLPTDYGRSITRNRLLTNFDEVQDELIGIVSQWNRCRSGLGPVIELFIAVASNSSLILDARFLFLVQALEIYHSRSAHFQSKEIAPEELQRRVSILETQISPELWVWARGKLQLNSRSLRMKLDDVFGHHRSEFGKLWPSESDVSRRIVVTRNDLVHQNAGPGDPAILTTTEMLVYSARLEAFLWAILLKEVGLSKSPVEKVVNRVASIEVISTD